MLRKESESETGVLRIVEISCVLMIPERGIMNIQIDKVLYEIVQKKYSSLEYLIEETIPTISIGNLRMLPRYGIFSAETVSVPISEDVIDAINACMSEGWSVDDLVNYIIGLGFIMEV